MEKEKQITIALAGNPNTGKTTLFNILTGSNQFVGNWPGVTVEKKEGKLKGHKNVSVMDLPGIYSLSPYSLEEVVSRNYLIDERPDVILNLVDGTNLERNLYLTTQVTEIGIPVVVAVNMIDLVRKAGDELNLEELSRQLGCKVVAISALKEEGLNEAIDACIYAAENTKTVPQHTFSGPVEHAIAHIEEAVVHELPEEQQRWYAIKIFERDSKVIDKLKISAEKLAHVENDIKAAETELDDDAESIITNERYVYIASIIKACYKKKSTEKLTTSDKIDKIITNRWLGLPIFALIMYLVYYVSMVSVGQLANDWVNDGVFGDGWHLFGIGTAEYTEDADKYAEASLIVDGYDAYVEENGTEPTDSFDYDIVSDEDLSVETATATIEEYNDAVATLDEMGEEPDPANYGIWVPSIPDLISNGLDSIGAAEWLHGLIVDGVVAGLGAVLGFTPQILVLFFFLAFLEGCGYMARIAFVLDRVFRKFGLSGKSFIPMLIGTGCGVPGIMATRTIENERDRKMTVMTTTFIPCGAKMPFIALIAGAIFGGSAWISTGAYFLGVVAIIVSGIMLKKTKMFAGEPSPFVMELPAYHMPTAKNLLHSTWERGSAFIKKEFTLIALSTVVIWFCTYFGVVDGTFRMLSDEELNLSILAFIGNCLAWIFIPVGFGTWEAAAASITGLVAKENIVATMGICYGGQAEIGAAFTTVSGLAFLVFNLLNAPCFAAIGAIKSEMKSAKWTWFAIGYQCGFGYVIALIINQLGNLFNGNANILGVIVALAFVVFMLYMLVKPYKESTELKTK